MDNKNRIELNNPAPPEKRFFNRIKEIRWYAWCCSIWIIISLCYLGVLIYHDPSILTKYDFWGQFGDYTGGILGTFITYISIKLLVQNLKEQRIANDKLEAANTETVRNNRKNAEIYLLQQFDSNFNILLKTYTDCISLYNIKDRSGNFQKGKIAIHYAVETLAEVKLNEGSEYKDFVGQAQKKYEELFYIPNRDVAAVHFRTLYQIFELIRTAKISEEKRVLYAKIMRSQLSEDELILLRYNCGRSYGEKMQRNVNKYNLLKHIPIMNLMEFENWRSKFIDKEKVNRLDVEFMSWKKTIKNLFESQEKTYTKKISNKYETKIIISNDNKKFTFILIKYNTQNADTVSSSLDAIFDKCGIKELQALFKTFFTEIFVFSNFEDFNKLSNLNIEVDHETHQNDNTDIIKVEVSNQQGFVLVLSSSQHNKDPK